MPPGSAGVVAPPRGTAPLWQVLLAAFLVAVLVAAVHSPALSARAIAFDDNDYVINNRLVLFPSWENARRFFVEVLHPSTVKGYYQPLTMISLMVDSALGGGRDHLQPFHRTSLALHAANSALVLVLLYSLFGQLLPAIAAASLFGLHPMTVEPVSWLGERKTLLAAFFGLICLCCYVRYVNRRTAAWYAACLAAYLFALLSKPTSTPIVAVLILLDYWPLGRLSRRSLLEKIPFLCLGITSGLVTFFSQKVAGGASMPGENPLLEAALIVLHNVPFYLLKIAWPTELSPHYPCPRPVALTNPGILYGAMVSLLIAGLLIVSTRRTRAWLTGFLIYFVLLLPTMGVVRIANVVAADKYAYLPSVGLLMLLAWVLGMFAPSGDSPATGQLAPSRRWTIGVTAIVVAGAIAEAFAVRRQAAYWHDSFTLFSRMVQLAPDVSMLRWGLGNEHSDRGEYAKAVAEYEEALRLQPNYADAHNNLGVALRNLGRIDEAMAHYRESIRLAGQEPHAYANLGNELADRGQTTEAIAAYEEALRINPNDANAHVGLGLALRNLGREAESLEHYRAAIRIAPWLGSSYVNLGNALRQKGDLAGAMEQYRRCIAADPKRVEGHLFLGTAHLEQKKYDAAVELLRTVIALEPERADAHYFLGWALQELGKREESRAALVEALRLKPDMAPARRRLAELDQSARP